MLGKANVKGPVVFGKGAQFWAYISPKNATEEAVTEWEVIIEQKKGNWAGKITSKNPEEQLQTPGLSGEFNVTVMASGPKFSWRKLGTTPDSKPDIGCNSNCFAMVGIVANEDGTTASYWTTWDAFCTKK